ncbi:integrin-linked protein kinase homolog pat-4-like [Trichogramma pretiosum]|uniref:integrin-linked protein kinase homolog pat-4-like n=1 Tax=Trichogramma pretiosum TaxID=7493 RepID=UPI0006C93D71|nr:integrin-linked protein kinase homolog pat-4-like [Trichogramma pretiosum]
MYHYEWDSSSDDDDFRSDYSSASDFEPLRKDVNWEVDKDRFELLRRLHYRITWEWKSYRIPNFRSAFRDEEMDRLLSDCVNHRKGKHDDDDWLSRFIGIVAGSGYKDQPKDDDENRTTPIHRAARSHTCSVWIVDHLFDIYDRYDVNYRDETGLTHFHVACKYGCQEMVEKFLEAGQDPNVVWRKTGDSPLHLAVENYQPRVISSLLSKDADPNWANAEGSTPLHSICQRDEEMKMFFDICDELNRTVQVDVKDKKGLIPLQLAVANLDPNAVELLLDRGADLSSFTFPTGINYFDGRYRSSKSRLGLASSIVICVELLEKRGYELHRGDVLGILKLFSGYEMFLRSDYYNDDKNDDDEDFENEAKAIAVNSRLSLYDLFRSAEQLLELKQVTHADCERLSRSDEYRAFWSRRVLHRSIQLCDKISRKLVQDCALEPFWELMGGRLPLECCRAILGKLTNEDLYNICLASEG